MNQSSSRKSPRWVPWLPGLGILVGGVTGFIATRVITPVYRVSAELLVTSTEAENAGGLTLFSGNATTALTVLTGMMRSDAMVQHLAPKVGMKEREFRTSWSALPEPLTNQMTLAFEGPDPAKSKALILAAIEHGQTLESESGSESANSRAAQLRASLDKRTAEYRKQLDDLAILLTKLETPLAAEVDFSIVADQTFNELRVKRDSTRRRLEMLRTDRTRQLSQDRLPTANPMLERLRSDLIEAEANVRQLSETFGPEAPQLRQARERLRIEDAAYRKELERTRESIATGADERIAVLEAELRVLDWQITYQGRLRERGPSEAARLRTQLGAVETAQKSVTELRGQYELARMDAEVKRVRWMVLTPPVQDERPVNTRLGRYPVAGAALGFAVGLVALTLIRRPLGRSM